MNPDLMIMVVALADLVCSVDKLMAHEGILSLLQFAHDFGQVSTVKLPELKQELSQLDAVGRKQLEEAFKAKIILHNPDLQLKIDHGVDLLEESIVLAEQVFVLIAQGSDLVSKVKTLLSA